MSYKRGELQLPRSEQRRLTNDPQTSDFLSTLYSRRRILKYSGIRIDADGLCWWFEGLAVDLCEFVDNTFEWELR